MNIGLLPSNKYIFLLTLLLYNEIALEKNSNLLYQYHLYLKHSLLLNHRVCTSYENPMVMDY